MSLLNSCPLTSFYKGRGRALINKHALSFGPVVNYFSIYSLSNIISNRLFISIHVVDRTR